MNHALSVAALVGIALLGGYRYRKRYPKQAIVLGLFVYPVKGLKGIQVRSAQALQRGLQHDRRFMVTDSQGNFKTQREIPQMATVECQLMDDGAVLRLVNADGSKWINVTNWADPNAKRLTVRVWKAMVDNAVDQGDEVASWLSDVLQYPGLRLVYMDDNAHRPVDEVEGHEVSFADAFPVLIASASSLEDLNRRIEPKELIPMTRFRPNIVLDGLYPWTEDTDGAKLHFPNGLTVRIVRGCDRCKVTTIDQNTGVQKSQEPLRTLRTFRRIYNTTDVYFATNGVFEKLSDKPINFGDIVDIEWFP